MDITTETILKDLNKSPITLSNEEKGMIDTYILSKRPNYSVLKRANLSWSAFMQLFFEATVFNYLTINQFSILPSKDDGPDFKINFKNFLINIEVTAPDMQTLVVNHQEDDDFETGIMQPQNITSRWLRGIKDKNEKYQSYLDNGRVSAEDINIIAISNHTLTENLFLSFYTDPTKKIPHALECAYPIDSAVLAESGWVNYRASVEDKNKTPMQSGLFLFKEYAATSAILAYDKEKDDWVIIHNPLAQNPMPQKIFDVQQEWVQVQSHDDTQIKCIKNLNHKTADC